MTKPQFSELFQSRAAGVLLHPSSLPGQQCIGDLGPEAHNFLHFIADCSLSVWQMLPLGPTHVDGSPYQCLSAHAGNPLLINLQWLAEQGWLNEAEIPTQPHANQQRDLLNRAAESFFNQNDPEWQHRFTQFCKKHYYWLKDFSLYITLKQLHSNNPWIGWPKEYRLRDPEALAGVMQEQEHGIRIIEFIQFVFFEQWQAIRETAQNLGIKLLGDMPIYVSMDSADVWACKESFLMDEDGHCQFVAGVPPDAFTDEGQLWGNPLYDWPALLEQDFEWWIQRFNTQLHMFDYMRIDHFRGLEACWHVPASEETAINGHWVETPGKELLNTLHKHFAPLPLIAEDLGVITDEVRALRDDFHLPGMNVLQFAFDGDSRNLYLPHNHHQNSVVYTGTHDNDTSLGWYQTLPYHVREQLHAYVGHPGTETINMPWIFNRMALASTSKLCILPMQDLLSLDSNHRMNKPGTTEDNWQWRFNWQHVWPSLPTDLSALIRLYDR